MFITYFVTICEYICAVKVKTEASRTKGLGFDIGFIFCILLVFSFLQLCQVLRVGFSSVVSDGSETWVYSRGYRCGNVLALHGAIPVGHVLQPRTQFLHHGQARWAENDG